MHMCIFNYRQALLSVWHYKVQHYVLIVCCNEYIITKYFFWTLSSSLKASTHRVLCKIVSQNSIFLGYELVVQCMHESIALEDFLSKTAL